MSVIEAIILGVVQGLTEFLPVSSSGHLVLLQKIFGISQDALLFDTMVHVGTLVAVFAVLWKDIWNILKNPIQPLTGCLIVATIPAVIAALIFKDAIEAAFASASFLGIAFLLTSAALLGSDVLSMRKGEARGQGKMNALDAVIIGAMQAIAIIPGVSRSGFTLSGALSRKLDRNFAARFSFLLSIPAILGALALQLKDIFFATASTVGAAAEAAISAIGVAPIAAGTIAAALVGFFSVKLMLRIVSGHRLWGFAIYTGVVGMGVLLFFK